MELFIKVSDENDNIIEIPTENDYSISLATLISQFFGATGLKYQGPNGFWRALRIDNDKIIPPKDLLDWQEIVYRVVQNKENKRKIDDIFDDNVKYTKKILPKKCSDLIVLGLNLNTTTETLKKTFLCFGNIKKDKSGKSKGFGFIRFSDYESQLKVLMKKFNIDGKWCLVKLPDSKGGNAALSGSKLFIGGVDHSLTANDLKKFFETTFQTRVVDVFFVPTKNYAFVTFLDWDIPHSLYGESFEIKGKSIFCRPADPISDNSITNIPLTKSQAFTHQKIILSSYSSPICSDLLLAKATSGSSSTIESTTANNVPESLLTPCYPNSAKKSKSKKVNLKPGPPTSSFTTTDSDGNLNLSPHHNHHTKSLKTNPQPSSHFPTTHDDDNGIVEIFQHNFSANFNNKVIRGKKSKIDYNCDSILNDEGGDDLKLHNISSFGTSPSHCLHDSLLQQEKSAVACSQCFMNVATILDDEEEESAGISPSSPNLKFIKHTLTESPPPPPPPTLINLNDLSNVVTKTGNGYLNQPVTNLHISSQTFPQRILQRMIIHDYSLPVESFNAALCLGISEEGKDDNRKDIKADLQLCNNNNNNDSFIILGGSKKRSLNHDTYYRPPPPPPPSQSAAVFNAEERGLFNSSPPLHSVASGKTCSVENFLNAHALMSLTLGCRNEDTTLEEDYGRSVPKPLSFKFHQERPPSPDTTTPAPHKHLDNDDFSDQDEKEIVPNDNNNSHDSSTTTSHELGCENDVLLLDSRVRLRLDESNENLNKDLLSVRLSGSMPPQNISPTTLESSIFSLIRPSPSISRASRPTTVSTAKKRFEDNLSGNKSTAFYALHGKNNEDGRGENILTRSKKYKSADSILRYQITTESTFFTSRQRHMMTLTPKNFSTELCSSLGLLTSTNFPKNITNECKRSRSHDFCHVDRVATSLFDLKRSQSQTCLARTTRSDIIY